MGYLLFHAAASPLMTPTPALLGDQSHSFLDNTIALFGHIRAWDCSPESRRYGDILRRPDVRIETGRGSTPQL